MEVNLSVYNICSIIEFYALCGYGEEKDIYWDTYVALCKAFGIPLDWERLHEERETEESSSIYEDYRRTFQKPFVEMRGEACYGDWRPFGARMFRSLIFLRKSFWRWTSCFSRRSLA